MARFLRNPFRSSLLAMLCFFSGLVPSFPLAAAPVFSVPGFVDEPIHLGNGMISLAFDHEGNLLVTEKQGRVLLLKPNTGAPAPSFAYQYYEGTWTALPDFSALTPVATGVVSSISLEPRLRNDYFGLVFTGQLHLPASGEYTFYTRSDDGSRIYINDTLVVDHDGLHGATEMSGNITLAAGSHTLRVEYFEAAGGEALEVSYAGPDQPKQVIGANSGPFLAPTVFADIVSQVNSAGERGLMGFALDPDYANNRYLYLLFSTNSDQRIVRYTANTAFTAVEPGSALTLLSGLPNATNVHKAGDIAFRPGEPYNLYVMLGDDGDRYVVGDLDLYHGKLLRIDSATGLGLPDNPHYDGNPASVRSRVFSHRYRNPFRFAFDPANSEGEARLYLSENGDGTDRIVRVEKGADGGWDPQFLTDSSDGKRKILYTTLPSITAIAFLRGGPFAPDGPMLYNARYGGNDRKEVRRWRVTGAALDTLEPLPEDNGEPFLTGFTSFNIVSFTQGPDGALYFTDSNQGSSTGNGYRLGRIRYVGGEAPVAAFSISPDPAVGAAPLLVSFTDASTFSDAAIAQWSWEFGDGTTSTSPSPSHTYAAPGVYTVRLTVTDTIGLNHSLTDEITVVHPVSLTLDALVRDARAAGSPVPLAVPTELRLYQADGVTPLPFAGGLGVSENILLVPVGGALQTTISVALTGPGVVVSAGEPATDGVASAFAGFALSLSAFEQQIAPVFNLAPTLVRGRATDTLGAAAPLDIGVARGVSKIPYAVAGGRDFLPGSGHLAIGVAHRVVADALGYFHVPVRDDDGGVDFTLDATADTLVSTHGRVSTTVFVPAGIETVRDLRIGLYDGATGVDDLSAIAPTPAVDFITQIQPIFTAQCMACHNDIATNSGGLDLQPWASYAALVNVLSVEAPGVKLVEPGRPDRSYLMEKISSAQPQVGTRMRPGDPMALALQALMRDWITQLKPPHPHDTWRAQIFGEEVDEPAAQPGADYDGDGVSNLLAYALGVSPLESTPVSALPAQETTEIGEESYLTLRVVRDPTATGLIYAVEATADLADASSWNSTGTVALVDTPSLLVVRDAEPISAGSRRFLRLRVTMADEP